MTPCTNCNSEAYVCKRVWWEHGKLESLCDQCGEIYVTTIPDVFLKSPYKSEALGVEFTSKTQKARYLKEHGLQEAGDMKMSEKSWIDGTREHRKRMFDKDRPKIREAIKAWRQRASR